MTFRKCVLLSLLPAVTSSSWDPHPLPSNADAWFEGWYTRLTLSGDTNDTIALVIGAARLPPGAPDPPVYVALLHGRTSEGVTTVYDDDTPPVDAVELRSHGGEVTRRPKWDTPPDFEWTLGNQVHYSTVDRRVALNANIAGAKFSAELEVDDWMYDGRPKPHSWSDVLDGLPLHWYIHTLTARVITARLEVPIDEGVTAPVRYSRKGRQQLLRSGDVGGGLSSPIHHNTTRVIINATSGTAHLEKNWGQAFPTAWLWSQGATEVEDGYSFAVTFSYGRLYPNVFTHLTFIRDKAVGIAWDMAPGNSRLVRNHTDGCEGTAEFELRDLTGRRHVILRMRQPQGSAGCLMGPTDDGFTDLCEESFLATIQVELQYDNVTIRSHTVHRSALEYGGTFRCDEGRQPKCVEGHRERGVGRVVEEGRRM